MILAVLNEGLINSSCLHFVHISFYITTYFLWRNINLVLNYLFAFTSIWYIQKLFNVKPSHGLTQIKQARQVIRGDRQTTVFSTHWRVAERSLTMFVRVCLCECVNACVCVWVCACVQKLIRLALWSRANEKKKDFNKKRILNEKTMWLGRDNGKIDELTGKYKKN